MDATSTVTIVLGSAAVLALIGILAMWLRAKGKLPPNDPPGPPPA